MSKFVTQCVYKRVFDEKELYRVSCLKLYDRVDTLEKANFVLALVTTILFGSLVLMTVLVLVDYNINTITGWVQYMSSWLSNLCDAVYKYLTVI